MLSKEWTFYRKSSINLKAWEESMDFDYVSFDSKPVWIQFPKLNWRFWSPHNLSKLSSFVGMPIAMDRLTTNHSRLGCARVLVDLHVRVNLPESVPITNPDGREYQQQILYEHLMPKCL